MKIGMKEDMGVANKMTLSNFGSHTQSAKFCAKRAQTLLFVVYHGIYILLLIIN